MKNKIGNYITIGILLVFILFVNCHYLHMKSGYYVDEGMTLFLANGNYNGAVTSKAEGSLSDFFTEFVFKESLAETVKNVFSMLGELTSAGNYSQEGTVAWYDAARSLLQGQRTWMDGEELFRQLTASKGERFQYAQVYLNQAMDVHPPLYYLLVHTVFSIFPGRFHNAYLFVVNIAALLCTCVVLWKIAEIFSKNKCLPTLAVILFGLSQGFLSCALYFRMYALFTLFAATTVYLHLVLEKSNYQSTRKLSVFFIGTVVLGFYTHYYYIIFLFPIFVITVIKMMWEKKKTELAGYIKRMVIAGVISLILWPLSLYHILFGYRGTEAVSNLTAGGLLSRIRNYYGIVSQAFFYNNKFFFLIVLLAAGCVFVVGFRRKTVKQMVKSPVMEMLVVCIFYMLIMSQIAPTQSDRYIMCLYPLVALLIALLYVRLMELAAKSERVQIGMTAVVAVITVVGSLCLTSPNYLYLEQRDMELGVEGDASLMNCLMIADDDWRGFPEALKMSRFGQVIVLGEQELPLLEEEKPDNLTYDTIVYVLGELEQEKNLKETCRLLGSQMELMEEVTSDIAGFRAYLLKTGM